MKKIIEIINRIREIEGLTWFEFVAYSVWLIACIAIGVWIGS